VNNERRVKGKNVTLWAKLEHILNYAVKRCQYEKEKIPKNYFYCFNSMY
jgi:ppGpp synthetase/RelA/SpoT-type nucleotidyltranferase